MAEHRGGAAAEPVAFSSPAEQASADEGRQPTVSVIVPTHRRPEMVRRCVQAIVDQTYAGAIEVLVVFDQCDPHPIEVRDRPRRTIRQVSNDRRQPGLAGARNTGILEAGGEYIGFCDDDDLWLPTKLEAQLGRLRQAADGAACATGMYVDTGRRRIVRRAPERTLVPVDFVRDRLMEVHPGCLLIRRADLEAVGMVDEDVPHGYGEDYDFVLRLASVVPIVTVPDPLVVVAYHTGSYYAANWQVMIDGLEYLQRKHPELAREPRGSARILGQLALAYGGLGRRREALALVRRALRANPLEKRALLAVGVVAGVPAERLSRTARSFGRGL